MKKGKQMVSTRRWYNSKACRIALKKDCLANGAVFHCSTVSGVGTLSSGYGWLGELGHLAIWPQTSELMSQWQLELSQCSSVDMAQQRQGGKAACLEVAGNSHLIPTDQNSTCWLFVYYWGSLLLSWPVGHLRLMRCHDCDVCLFQMRHQNNAEAAVRHNKGLLYSL